MSSYKVERYRDIKNVFNNITSIGDPAFCNYVELKENTDALALNFIINLVIHKYIGFLMIKMNGL